jgi:hypothetical protein
MTEDVIPKELQTISDWQFAFLITMFVLLVIALVTLPADAMTITMSNPGAMAERDIYIYFSNGSLADNGNTTSTFVLDGNESYMFMMKPTTLNPFDDLSDWFTNAFVPAVKNNAVVLIFVMVLIGFAYSRR